MKLDKTKPPPKNTRSLQPGDQIGPYQVVGFEGFCGTTAVFKFKCVCGRTFIQRGPFVKSYKKRAFCKCQQKKDDRSKHPAYHYWMNNKERLGEFAKDFWEFAHKCWPLRKGPNEHLWSVDKAKPLGPDNFVWQRGFDYRRDELMQTVINDLVSRGESKTKAEKRVTIVSRQRLFQLFYRATGRCTQCRKTSMGKTGHCRKCRDKQNKYKRERNNKK